GAGGAASGPVSWTAGSDHAENCEEEKPQRSGGGLREKAGRAALARAEFGRTVPLCGTTDAAGQILAAARACHRAAAERWGRQRHTRSLRYGHGRTRAVPSLPQV